MHWNTKVRLTDITDGTSSTILLGERSHHEPLWDRFEANAEFGVYAQAFAANRSRFHMRAALERVNWRLPESMSSGRPFQAQSFGTLVLDPASIIINPENAELFFRRLSVYGSGHPGGANAAMADGSVRFLTDAMPLDILQSLSTREGAETINEVY
jgi:prepilin-type processing-associated H-X9-DG protein